MSESMFDNYEQEFKNITTVINGGVAALPTTSGDERTRTAAKVEKELTEAESLVQQMDLEVRSMAADKRSELQNRVRGYKSTLSDMKSRYKDARAAFPSTIAARDELLGGARESAALKSEAQSQRARLLAQTETLQKSSTRLEETHRIVLETEQIGEGILADLSSQRETLESTRDKLRGADTDLARSRRILQGMARRALANKFIMIGIIIALVMFICLIVYIQWFAGGDGSDASGDNSGAKPQKGATESHDARL
mmetsp:Transcript_20722/g.53538  ORF Transcript_20722/g.53538 Transcript_20722/m.53538 type:complete len:254 (+) Transcript_20722:101-862(+)